MPEQTFWRHCSECHMLFWDGYPHDKGVCSNGRGHLADGLIFALSYGVGQTANSQDSWYCCKKCKVMFYRGYGDNGKCFKGGGHEADWINFTLPFSISASNSSQDKWRFCNKCRVMFYEGYTLKNCADGGIHEARGQIFTLPHEGK